jgi:hypothetical protein
MKAQADKLFESEQYLDATPLYMRLLSLQPRDANYNYRYGTCLLYNSNNKPDAIKYLNMAISDPNIAPEAYYFLGKALHYNYQFNEAIRHYTSYNEKKASAVKKFDADREIQMCQNGKRLMTTISDLIVVDKKEIQKDKFFRIYDLKDIGGSMLVTAEFQTKLDKKNNHTPLIHFPQNPSVIYYSSFGEDGDNGKDIYVRRRLPDGSWGMPQPIPGNVNTKYDEDYPYMHPDGNYLYFSSKGHNSMGGYDVFRSKYDPETNSFGPPENMDFAISSPDDDLFYIVDSLNKNAYFASARQSQDGKLFVYQVKVDRVPLQLSVVKGNFLSEIDPSKKRIDFEIRDYSNGDNIGRFNSNEKGVYLITFPKGGKYEFIMRVEGVPNEFRTIVSIPFLKEFKPLKQKIVHTNEEGREVVKVIDLFNEQVEDPQAVIAEVIKMRSDLNINVQEFDMDQLEKERQQQEMLNELGFEDLILVEVSNALKEEVRKAKENKDDIGRINNNINALVVQNTEDLNRLGEQIKNKVAESSKVENDENKYILLREAEQLIKKQNDLKTSSELLLRLADSVNTVVRNSSTAGKINELNTVAEQFDRLYREGKEDEALSYLQENKDLIKSALVDNTTNLKENLVERVVKIDEQLKDRSAKINGYNNEIKQLELEVQALENSRYSVKKKELEALDAKIASKKEEIEMIREQRIKLEKKVDELNQEKFLLNKQIQVLEVALSNPSVVAVSREAADKAARESSKTNTNTLNSYVEQQIAELEKKDPTLRERIIVSTGMKGDNIMSEHRTLKQRIEETQSISKEERLKRLIANSVQTKRALESRLSDVEKQLAGNKFDEALNREKQQILKDLEMIRSEIDRYEAELNAGLPVDVASVNDEQVTEQVDPGYEDRIEQIRSNTEFSETDRLKEEQKADQDLVSKLDDEISANEQRLKNDPQNRQLQERQKVLKSIKEEKEGQISQRSNQITTAESKQADQVALTEEEVAAKVDPAYVERFSKINNDRTKPEIERFTAMQDLDRDHLNKVDRRIGELETQLKKQPNNFDLKNELSGLKNYRQGLNKRITEREEQLVALRSGATVPSAIQVSDLDPDYEQRVSSLNRDRSLNSLERSKQLKALEEGLLQKINEQVARTEKQLQQDLTDSKVKADLQRLKELQADAEERLEQLDQQIAQADQKGTNENEVLLVKLDPDYSSGKEEVKNDNSLSEIERLDKIEKLNEELIKKIDVRIAELNSGDNKNDPQVVQEIADLDNLRTATQQEITSNKERLSDLKDEKGQDELVSEVDPSYQKETDAIRNNAKLSEDQKNLRLIERDKELLESVSGEEKKIRQQLEKEPEDKSALEQKEDLQELRSVVEARINEREQLIESKALSAVSEEQFEKGKNDLRAEVSPEYSSRKVALVSGSANDKYDQLIALEEELITALKKELSAVQKTLTKDPLNQDALVRQKMIESLIADAEGEKEKWALMKQESLADRVTDADKEEALRALDPKYAQDRIDEAQLRVADEQTLSDQYNLEQELMGDINTRLEADRKVLEEDPGNKELLKEIAVLEDLKQESEARIKILDEELKQSSTESAYTFTSNELENKINEIDPQYNASVTEIEAEQGTNAVQKLEELNALDRKLLNTVIDAIAATEEKLQSDRGNTELKREKALLEKLADDIEKGIEERDQEIIKYKENETLLAAQDEEWLDQFDPSYKKDITFIQNNPSFDLLKKLEQIQKRDMSLLEKIETRLEQINKMPQPKPVEVLNEQKALEDLKRDLITSTTERKEAIDRLRSEQKEPVSALDAETLTEQLVPGFKENREQILNDESLSEEMRKDLAVQLEEALQQKAEERLVQVERQLNTDPTDAQIAAEKSALEDVIALSQTREKELTSDQIVNKPAQDKIVAEISADYVQRKKDLTASKMEESKKIEELIKLENGLLTELRSELKTVEKQLVKDPENKELLARKENIKALITEHEAGLSALQSRKKILADQLIAEKVITAVDKEYNTEVESLKSQPEVEERNRALADREKEHQDLLTEKIEQNEQALEKKDNPQLRNETAVLKEELTESQEREAEYRRSSQNVVVSDVKKEEYILNLREDLLASNSGELTKDYSTVEELKAQDAVLAQYELDLKKQIEGVEQELKADPQSAELKDEKTWLNAELQIVQQKRRQISIEVGELETELITENTQRSVESPQLTKLEQEEQQIEKQLQNTELTNSERKVLEKQLTENRNDQVEEENKLLTAKTNEQSKEVKKDLTEIRNALQEQQDPELKIAQQKVEQENKEAEQLIAEAQDSRSEAEKNYLLNEASVKQDRAKELAENALYENELKKIEEQYELTSLSSKEELEKKRRRFSVEIGELTTEIIALDTQIADADKKEKPILEKERKEKVEQRRLLEQQLQAVEAELAAMPAEDKPLLSEEADKVVISYNEERDIASTKEYAEYVEKVNDAIRTEEQIINLEKQLDEAKAQTRSLAADNFKDPSDMKRSALEKSAQQVKQLEEELAVSRRELEQKRSVADAVLPENTEEAMKIQNLVKRGIEPISKIAVAAALVPMPANGLEINNEGAGIYSEANRIPINVNNPTGLVYRVQIGAFAKPIEQDRFNKFNPVSGETLNNGITRYMAGYFNNSARVLEAMNQIRQLGYADAFPVAYCDGKRISLAEARRLEATGECVPKGTNELLIEMAANTAVTMGLEDTTKLKPVQEFTYNKAPGAAEAEPIEARKGLFFTVQIGVYNKPVTSATLFNLEPFMTLRLPNGQIRYSTGIYHSVDEARPRKQEAINRGVKDAFITAYYNGERIPINDAIAMLAEKGSSVLEPKEKPVEGTSNGGQTTATTVTPEQTGYGNLEKPRALPEKPKVYYQIATKKTFTEFPVEVLNRYNSHGSFYFDANDGRVKSAITDSDEELPQVYYFRDDVDTLKFISTEEFLGGTVLSLTFAEGKLPGDVVDYLLRLNYRKEYLQSEEGVTLLIHGVPEEKFEEINRELSVFGMQFTTVSPKEEETEQK